MRYLSKDQCQQEVEKPELLRLVRGRGFRRHYTVDQCKRKPKVNGYCMQHAKMKGMVKS